jgi:UDP-GlcNAc:undecaprenyl-phosphate GlcNAc-1-phosphate transferase
MPAYAASVVAFLITATLLLALRPLAGAVGLVDHPGGHKTHNGVVPVIGGISMLGGLVIAALMGGDLGHPGVVVLLVAIFMVLIGVLDDRFNLAPLYRLFGQAAAAIAVTYGTGFLVSDLGNLFGFGAIGLRWLALPFTVVACMALVNAFNMLDGLDGLAGGCGLVAFLGLSVMAILNDAPVSAALAASLLGACIGFLIFNIPARFNRGLRTFMGDAGSTLLGFMLACIGLILVQPSHADIPPVFILWMMPIPIFELFTTTARRLVRGHSPVRGDSSHFHHHFIKSGFSVRLVFVMYAGISLLSAWGGIAALQGGVPEPVMFGLFVLFFVLWLAFVRLAPAIGERLPLRLRREVEKLPI